MRITYVKVKNYRNIDGIEIALNPEKATFYHYYTPSAAVEDSMRRILIIQKSL